MNFDRLAPHYDWMEAVTAGSLLQRARTCWLPELAGCRSVLSVGEGHGRFAAAFLAANPNARLTCLEASPAMLQRAKKRVERETTNSAGRVHWINTTIEAWEPDTSGGSWDAIVTCFFLDCFPTDELAAVVKKLARCAAPEAYWLNVDFSLPSKRGAALVRARVIHAIMYAFFSRATGLRARRLTPPDPVLSEAGFSLFRRRDFDWGLLRADLWQRGRAARENSGE